MDLSSGGEHRDNSINRQQVVHFKTSKNISRNDAFHPPLMLSLMFSLLFPPRYQYYLQVKKEVLDGRLHCAVEQGIRLAGLAVQGETHTCTHKSLMGIIDWSERESNSRFPKTS